MKKLKITTVDVLSQEEVTNTIELDNNQALLDTWPLPVEDCFNGIPGYEDLANLVAWRYRLVVDGCSIIPDHSLESYDACVKHANGIATKLGLKIIAKTANALVEGDEEACPGAPLD